MTRAYSVAFRQKMIERLTGKDAVSANQLSKETGVRQQNLSRCPIGSILLQSLRVSYQVRRHRGRTILNGAGNRIGLRIDSRLHQKDETARAYFRPSGDDKAGRPG